LNVVVTAGPTREYLDPVRFLSNPSTGKMGFAIAAEAARRGYAVTLIAGPVALKTPKGERMATAFARKVIPLMVTLRKQVDEMETMTSSEFWPMPNYGDMMFRI
jgi:phosphopantothenoylcysteine decarboxylase/phosphopantothenate--cysteine ligase